MFKKGELVLATDRSWGKRYYVGTITHVYSNHRDYDYQIQFNDGDQHDMKESAITKLKRNKKKVKPVSKRAIEPMRKPDEKHGYKNNESIQINDFIEPVEHVTDKDSINAKSIAVDNTVILHPYGGSTSEATSDYEIPNQIEIIIPSFDTQQIHEVSSTAKKNVLYLERPQSESYIEPIRNIDPEPEPIVDNNIKKRKFGRAKNSLHVINIYKCIDDIASSLRKSGVNVPKTSTKIRILELVDDFMKDQQEIISKMESEIESLQKKKKI